MENARKLILASKSPRRLRLLAGIVPKCGILVIGSNIEEHRHEGEDVENYCKRIAQKKAMAAWDKYEGDRGEIAAVIGADTIVLLNEHIIGQPEDPDDAMRILMMLNGKCHEVITGVAVLMTYRTHFITFVVRSKVWMYSLSEKEISDYIITGEPMDMAGAYAIQGRGRRLIQRYEGSYSNIVGLPVAELKQVLSGLIPLV
jgi:septum formation protein